ncbi:MAG: class I SAM-dependent methyltransferase [Acidimicrobiia bacterium]
MSAEEQQRWDERYATGEYQPRSTPSPFVVAATRRIPRGRALVLACGTGRNALYLAEAGFKVEAVDISEVAIARAQEEAQRRNLAVDFRVADLDRTEFPEHAYRLVTMVRYVNRRLWPKARTALAPNGWLLTEQHLKTDRDVIGPTGAYRVEPGELLDAFSSLRIVEYWEGVERADRDGKEAVLARLLACNGNPGF